MPRLPKNPKKQEAVALRQQGFTYGQIADKLQVKPGSVAGWVGMAKRKALALEARNALKNNGSSSLAPSIPQLSLTSLDIQTITSAALEKSSAPRPEKAEISESALRAKALSILARAEKKRLTKQQADWVDTVLSRTSKTTGKGEKGSTGKESAYTGMGDLELLERSIASACAMLGGHVVDGLISRLKDEGQFYI